MTTPLICLVVFACWTLALVAFIFILRAVELFSGRKRINEFPAGVEHGNPFYWRLNRAHLNALENLPIFAGLVLTSSVAHISAPHFATLAEVVVCARVVQTLAHVTSGSERVVLVRASAFFTQAVTMGVMGISLLWMGWQNVQ